MHPQSVVLIPAEMLTASPPDLTTVAAHAVRQAERDAVNHHLAELGFPKNVLSPVTVGEYRRAATAAGIPAADIEAIIADGIRYLIDIVADLAE